MAGWRDAPVIQPDAAGEKPPAWAAAPLVGQAPPSAAAPLAGVPAPGPAHHAFGPLEGLATFLRPILHQMAGAAQIGASGLTGALATPVAGLAALPAGPAALLSGQDPLNAQAEVARNVREQLTYKPGQAAADLVAPVAPALRKAGAAVSNMIPDTPLAQTAAEALPDLAANLLPFAKGVGPAAQALEKAGVGVAEATAAPVLSAAERAAKEATNPIVKVARSMDYKLRPSAVQATVPGASVPGTLAEHLNSPAALKREFTLHNQGVTTREAGTDIGVPNAARLDDAAFNKVKAPEIKVYQDAETAATKGPLSPELQAALTEAQQAAKFKAGETPGITRTLSAVRRRSAKLMQSQDIATEDAGYAMRDLADKLETQFGAQLKATGNANMLAQFQAARQRLAKIHDVEAATKAGQVDALMLSKMADRGVPMTGRLKMIADVGQNFPNDVRHSLSTAASQIENEANKSRIFRDIAGATVRNIPGLRSKLNVRTPGFQERLGPLATPEEQAAFGAYGKAPVTAPSIGQLTLEPPPGTAFEPHQPGMSLSEMLAPTRPAPYEVQAGPAFEPGQHQLPLGTPSGKPSLAATLGLEPHPKSKKK